MYLELAEHLKCPVDHEETCLVVATGAMRERAIVFGTIGCPVCRAEYMIVNRVARFGERPADLAPAGASHDPEAVQALLGLESPGGFVILVGAAARLADPLAARMEGVHFVAIDGPEDIVGETRLTLLEATASIPLRSAMARGVVIGADFARQPWLDEAVRVLLRGQRVVVLSEGAVPAAVEPMATGQGMWVGKKTV